MGKAEFRFLQERLKNSPVESLALLLIGPWLLNTLGKGIVGLINNNDATPKQGVVNKNNNNTSNQEGKNNEVKYRGKTFQQTDSKESVDLSWLGALPYWVPVCIIGLESIFMFRNGVEHFKRRGYTPGQRHLFQAYFFFGILPLVDLLSGDDWANPTKEQQKDRRLAYRFRLPLYIWTVVEFILTLATFRLVLDGKNGLSKRSRFALMMQLGLFNGVFGINVSHELLHKNNRFERMLAWLLLTNVNYCHWMEEHETGHHANVATPQDPATSNEGETVYSFLPRTFVGGWKSSCELEQKRLLKEGIDRWYTPKNRVIKGVIGSAFWAAILARINNNMLAIPLFYAQGVLSALLLEVVNYIEHFGLQRRRDPVTGNYEPVDPRHSWNAPNRLSNTILFKLQRHSDHHTFASRPYEILRNFVESPQMPCGYVGMFVLAMFPPAFFYIMNPLLQAHRLEFHGDANRQLTQDEVELVKQLKLSARNRIWAWTLSTFGASTYLIVRYFENIKKLK